MSSFTAEVDKSVVEPSAESAPPAPAPSPTPDSSGDKPKEAVAEQSPPAPVEQSVEKKTDDKDPVSNKTSVESLKETNENNSNNADLTARGVSDVHKLFSHTVYITHLSTNYSVCLNTVLIPCAVHISVSNHFEHLPLLRKQKREVTLLFLSILTILLIRHIAYSLIYALKELIYVCMLPPVLPVK